MKHGGGYKKLPGSPESNSGTYGSNPVKKASDTGTSKSKAGTSWQGVSDSRADGGDRKQTAK